MSKLLQIIVQILDTLRFETLLGKATCTVHLRLNGKLLVDFLFVLINFSLGGMAEALRANID